MKRLRVAPGIVLVLLTTMSPALAAANPSGTGQPSQTCVDTKTAANEPGQAASAPGSAFNETGPGAAGTVYAGNGVSATRAGVLVGRATTRRTDFLEPCVDQG